MLLINTSLFGDIHLFLRISYNDIVNVNDFLPVFNLRVLYICQTTANVSYTIHHHHTRVSRRYHP
jgi:hypothetical protein